MKIGIIGRAGAGKDTVANILRDECGFVVERFADPLKRAALSVFGATFDDRNVKEVSQFVTEDMYDRMIDATIALCHDLNFTSALELAVQDRFFQVLNCEGGPMSPRRFQQLLGSDCIRAVCPNAFVDRVAYADQHNLSFIAIPDVRFENELQTQNILVYRPGVAEVAAHPSEVLAQRLYESVTLYDNSNGDLLAGTGIRVLRNEGSLEDLKIRTVQLWKSMEEEAGL
jgi:hypothetical protein